VSGVLYAIMAPASPSIRFIRGFATLSVALMVGCNSSSAEPPAREEGSDAGSTPAPLTLSAECTADLDSLYAPLTDLPAYDATHRGDVVGCAVDRTYSVAQIEQILNTNEIASVDVKSSVRAFRVRYRTERFLGQEGLTAALLYLPDRPIATRSPLVVFGHGFGGLSPDAAFSKVDLSARNEEAGTALALAGVGYPVIAPDYPGFVAAGSPSFALAEDEGHSLLDGTRAAKNLLAPGGTTDQVVMVGHSQGGHAVLSAQALSPTYGMEGKLSAVVALAPYWAPGRLFGAILAKAAGYNTTDNANALSSSIAYLYTHAELYDGPGAGIRLFQPSALATLATLGSTSTVADLGRTPYDYFDNAFLDEVAPCAFTTAPEDCKSEVASKWLLRFRADRPHLDGTGAEILLWQGGKDAFALPPVVQCGIDKIAADFSEPGATASFTACADAEATHNGLLSRDMGWVIRWIEARTIGTPEPEVCRGPETLQLEGGGAVACPEPPGNTD
jgi:pimeloyl-ACP methyl ester carboxylesterase